MQRNLDIFGSLLLMCPTHPLFPEIPFRTHIIIRALSEMLGVKLVLEDA